MKKTIRGVKSSLFNQKIINELVMPQGKEKKGTFPHFHQIFPFFVGGLARTKKKEKVGRERGEQ